MRAPEQRLWDAMRKNRPSGIWLQRVENLAAVGVPDVYYATRSGRSGWIELKAVTLPKRSSTRVLGTQGLRTEQVAWHAKAVAFGVRSYVLIRDNELNLYLVMGDHASKLNDMNIDQLKTVSLTDSWQGIFLTLK